MITYANTIFLPKGMHIYLFLFRNSRYPATKPTIVNNSTIHNLANGVDSGSWLKYTSGSADAADAKNANIITVCAAFKINAIEHNRFDGT